MYACVIGIPDVEEENHPQEAFFLIKWGVLYQQDLGGLGQTWQFTESLPMTFS